MKTLLLATGLIAISTLAMAQNTQYNSGGSPTYPQGYSNKDDVVINNDPYQNNTNRGNTNTETGNNQPQIAPYYLGGPERSDNTENKVNIDTANPYNDKSYR